MTPLQCDGRRLHPRFQINEIEELLHYSTPSNPAVKSAVKVTEIAQDSMTCKLSCDVLIPVGTKVTLELSQHNSGKTFNGKVASCSHQSGSTRVGILFAEDDILSLFPPPAKHTSPNQRKAARRNETSEETGKREFDRRGLWPGVLPKRFFSHYIWGLQNNNEYFYRTPIQSATDAHVIVDGREMVMMSSNNYLGLSTHPKVKESAIAAINKYGSGSCASAVIGGMLDIHLQLEEALAQFEGVEDVCLFSSGYVANVSTLLTILQKGDAVFNDELNHASLLDGSKLSGADLKVFRHLDFEDLDHKLSKNVSSHKLVVIDGVFSMDGEIAPLPDIYRIAKKHGAALMVDEAHATGVFGKKGRGLLEHFGMQGKADIVIGTMSKTLGATGGFIGGNKELIKILRHTARGSIFSANLTPVTCATVLTALKLIDEEPERLRDLWRNTNQLRTGLGALGFNVGATQSPIIPIVFPTERQTKLVTHFLREQGVFVCPVVYPAVKKNQTRVRLSVMASHTDEDIEKVIASFSNVKRVLKRY